jgi:protein-tyrosine phosphatase
LIDLHCHILPAIDDGAADLEDAVAMARQAEADGIELVCATPHIRHDHDVLIEELPRRVGDLNAELARRGVQVEIGLGCEVAETAVTGLSPEELRGASLGGSGRWLLVEPAPGPLGESLLGTVRQLEALGFRSVIAHPERHPGEGLVERIRALVAQGALIQVTAAQLAAGDGAALFMFDLARQGLVHLLGSDAHSARVGRPVRLSDGLAHLAAVELVRPHIDWVANTGPMAILRGEEPEPPFSPLAA